MNIVSRSGTNAFLYVRDESMDARNACVTSIANGVCPITRRDTLVSFQLDHTLNPDNALAFHDTYLESHEGNAGGVGIGSLVDESGGGQRTLRTPNRRPRCLRHPPHTHTHEGIIILIEGTVQVSMEDRRDTVEAGWVIFYEPDTPHNLRSIGTTPSRYHVIEWRGRSD